MATEAPRRRLNRPLAIAAIVVALIIGLLLGTALGAGKRLFGGPDAETIATSALQSMRAQNRLVPFVARYVSVVSARQERRGGLLTSERTLVLPGDVRYELDLAQIGPEDVRWDEGSNTLSVTLPPLEISGPDIDLNQVQEYSEGGIVMALTDAERTLDQANRRSAQDELMRQARDRTPTSQARNAAMRQVARSFAMPLRAAGIDASVAVRFVDPSGAEEAFFLDRPRRIDEAVRDRQAQR
jgi:hypothetical protein